ncbi:MAG: YdcF family protein [Verrucomicrobia bacterium]|nr:YdcF family protein [Verrucomicrobiota bacterium]
MQQHANNQAQWRSHADSFPGIIMHVMDRGIFQSSFAGALLDSWRMASITRIVEALLQPIGLIWFLNLAVAVWAVYRRQWRPAIFCGTIAVSLFITGATSLPVQLLASLERPYAEVILTNVPEADAVVMLGGALGPSSRDSFRMNLSEGADRIIRAVELARQNKGPVLVLGGGGRNDSETNKWHEAKLIEAWLATWNLTNTPVICLNISSNTRDEAVQVRALAKERGWKRIILVTSAYHMKRSEGIFRQLGLPVAPVSCDFIGLSALERDGRFNPIPRSSRLEQLHVYLHEKIGWWYYRWRGWVTDRPQ